MDVPERAALVRLLNDHGASPRTLSRKIKVSHVTIHKWINELNISLKVQYV